MKCSHCQASLMKDQATQAPEIVDLTMEEECPVLPPHTPPQSPVVKESSGYLPFPEETLFQTPTPISLGSEDNWRLESLDTSIGNYWSPSPRRCLFGRSKEYSERHATLNLAARQQQQ